MRFFVCRQIEMGCFKILQYLKLYHLNLTVLIFCLPLYYQVVKLSLKGHDLSGKFVCFLFTVHNETFTNTSCSNDRIVHNRNNLIIEILWSKRRQFLYILYTLRYIFSYAYILSRFVIHDCFRTVSLWSTILNKLFVLGYFILSCDVFRCLSVSLHSFSCSCSLLLRYILVFSVHWYEQRRK